MAVVPFLAQAIASTMVAIGGVYPVPGGGPAVVRVCDPDSPRTARRRPAWPVYDLELRPIHPVVRGPRRRGAVAYRRVVAEIADELAALQDLPDGPLRACYRWARWAKPDLAGDVSIGMRIDEWGRISHVAPANDPIDREVAACLSHVLAGMRVGSYTPRLTDLAVTFRLRPSGQARPKRRPARPPTLHETIGERACAERPAVLPVDRPDEPPSVVVVDDFSRQQDEEETREKFRAELAAWAARGRRGPRPVAAPELIVCGPPRLRGLPRRGHVEIAVDAQRGDFEACYAAASARTRAVGGEVTLVASVNGAGQFDAARVHTSTTTDVVLARCLAGALEHAHVATGAGGTFEVRVPLRLVPVLPVTPPVGPGPVAPSGAPVNDEALAGEALDARDGSAAYDRYRGVLAKVEPARRCAAAVGLLQAALTAAPWQEDDRVSAAVDGVGDALRLAPRAARATCRKLAMPLLAVWVARPFELALATHRLDIMGHVAESLRRLLAFEPPLPGAGTLRVLRGDALLMQSRWTEAADELLSAARGGDLPTRWVAEAAASAAWAYARSLIAPVVPDQRREAIRRGPPPGALASSPDVASKLSAALGVVRRIDPSDTRPPWQAGDRRFGRAPTSARILALLEILPEPAITAMDPRDAWTYLRSLRIAGRQELMCEEARRLLPPPGGPTWPGPPPRLLDACLAQGEGAGPHLPAP